MITQAKGEWIDVAPFLLSPVPSFTQALQSHEAAAFSRII